MHCELSVGRAVFARGKQLMASKLDFDCSIFSIYCTETNVVNYLVVEVVYFKDKCMIFIYMNEINLIQYKQL